MFNLHQNRSAILPDKVSKLIPLQGQTIESHFLTSKHIFDRDRCNDGDDIRGSSNTIDFHKLRRSRNTIQAFKKTGGVHEVENLTCQLSHVARTVTSI
jgi:hypothetical protein